ncbi:MAG: EAL domain-containing protein [Gammaproteobacteria bacterium]|nr:MAG: EAL domain-containing protein [Gammaproteobacteria bacterium]
MIKRPALGLRARVLLILTPIVVIPLIAMGYRFFAEQAGEMRRQAEVRSEVVYQTVQETILDLDRQAAGQILLLAQLPQIRQYFLVDDLQQRNFLLYRPLLETFRTWLSANTAYEALFLLDSGGQIQIQLHKQGHKESHDATPPADQPWFRALRTLDARSTYRTLLSGSDTDVLYAHAIPQTTYSDWKTRADQEIAGYLVMRINLAPLAEHVRTQKLGETGFAVLLTPELKPISSAPGWSLQALSELANQTGSRPEPDTLSTVTLDDTTYFTRLHKLPLDLKLLTVWPANDTLRLARKVARTTLVWMSITVAITVFLLFFMLDRAVIHPIEALRDMAHDIGHNKLHTDNPDLTRHLATASRQDEIGALARAFQDMNINLRATSLKLRQIAYEDSLTGLANRHMFTTFLNKALAAAKRHHRHLVVMYIDIDGFKEVNDTLGHDAGDRVLREIAQRIQASLRDEDLVSRVRDVSGRGEKGELSRIGGDEFAIILTHIQEPGCVHLIAERILDALRKPFNVQNRQYQLGASIGVAMYPHDGEDASDLLKRADIAMYQAKHKGKDQVEFYSRDMEQRTLERQGLLQDLRRALKAGEFELHYQPQLNLNNGRIEAVEALLRWKHPEEGYIPPYRFIPIAEDSGLIVDIGQWVLQEACRATRRLHQAGLPWLRMAVNFSTVQFYRTHDVVGLVRDALNESGLHGRYLEMEITETAIMQSGEIAVDTLLKLHELGVTIAMDDFGTGYSSLATLRDLPIDILKIDKSFTDGILRSRQGQAIVRAILAMTRELGLQVVAEGVEQREQVHFYEAEGCHLLQGYHISRPMPETDLADWIRQFDARLLRTDA